MRGNPWEPNARVCSIDLGLDVALEEGARRVTARVALVEV
jgi:hypothetical protein